MGRRVETRRGLETLKKRYLESGIELDEYGIENYWIKVIDGCLRNDLAMDEDDYENTPKELRPLWVGLK